MLIVSFKPRVSGLVGVNRATVRNHINIGIDKNRIYFALFSDAYRIYFGICANVFSPPSLVNPQITRIKDDE